MSCVALRRSLNRNQVMPVPCFVTLTLSQLCNLLSVPSLVQNEIPAPCYGHHNNLGPGVPVLCTDAISRVHGCSPKASQLWFPQDSGDRREPGPTLHIWMVPLQTRDIPDGVKDALGSLDRAPNPLLTQQPQPC